ncbi:uncharacterized protein LOC111614282 [Centruroides sculpturatus]|uniref:uncharacterized protein LOC111614282 n=1 Tax=Centruroides sculpturatus TaxID=218467 RepID=UPI000C6C9E36|nr:uncharacterized protein LOC111614282 [Centruroides sculpturatus]
MDSETIELVPSDGDKILISSSTFNKIRNEQLESIMERGKNSRILKLPYPTVVVARMVNYLSTDDPQLKSLDSGFQLYDLSKKYSIKILNRKCEKFIIDRLSMKNVCAIHDFACKMNLSQIQHRCRKIFDTYWTEIFEGDDFKSCETTTIDRLVSRPLYTSMDEVDIFLAVYKWMKEKCKREMGTSFVQINENAKKQKYREELQPFLEKIRFLAMSKQELINKVFKLNLFTEEEEKSILVCKETKNFSDYPSYLSKNSNDRCRSKYSNYALLFEFKHIKESPRVTAESKKPFTYFTTEIFVREDCFVTNLNLPITLNSKYIPMHIYGYINSVESGVFHLESFCNSLGKVELVEPIFFGKSSTCRLCAVFAHDHWLLHNINLPLRSAETFATPEQSEGVLFEEKLIKDGIIEEESDNFYFLLYLISSSEIRIQNKKQEEIIISEAQLNKVMNRNFELLIKYCENSKVLFMPYQIETIRQFVTYVQTDDPGLAFITHAFDLYHLSLRYELDDLRKKCRSFIIRKINLHTVCAIHDFAREISDVFITYYCWLAFDQLGERLFTTVDFMCCKITTIDRLVSRAIYESVSEFRLLQAVYQWSIEEVKRKQGADVFYSMNEESERNAIRSVMEPFIGKFRFLAMNEDELQSCVVTMNLLSELEKIHIWHTFKTGNYYFYPSYFSRETKTRSGLNYRNLFSYVNKDPSMVANRKVKGYIHFSSEVVVMEDCYVTALRFPMMLGERFPMFVYAYINNLDNEYFSFHTVCNAQGVANLQTKLYLDKHWSIRFFAFFYLAENVQPDIEFLPQLSYFMSDEGTDARKFEDKFLIGDRNLMNNIYFSVDLYF